MGKRPGKPQTDTSLPTSLWILEKEQGPEGSALDLLQLESFSHSLPVSSPTWANILIFQSRPPPSSPVYSPFPSLVSLLSDCPALTLISPCRSSFCWSLYWWPLSKSSRFETAQLKMKAGGGGSEAEGISALLCPLFWVCSLHPGLLAPSSLSSPFCPVTSPYITHKRRRNRYAQEKASWSLAGKTRDPPSPPLIRQLVSLDVPKPYKYSLFSLISYYFFLSLSHIPLPASGFSPGRRRKLRRGKHAKFCINHLVMPPGPWQSRNPEIMASCLSSLLPSTHESLKSAQESRKVELNLSSRVTPCLCSSSIAGWASWVLSVLCFLHWMEYGVWAQLWEGIFWVQIPNSSTQATWPQASYPPPHL